MKKLTVRSYFSLLLLAFAGYFSLYFMIDKPLTTGEIQHLYDQKVALTRQGEGKRVFIFAGSNGRFSHSCEIISRELNRYCGNLSVAAGIGLDFLLASYEPNFRPGDMVYMPMEFQQYDVNKKMMYSGPENSILFKRNFSLLWSLGIERTFRAAFYANENYFLQGATEMLLQRKGIQRRFTEASVNTFGDQQGHTAELGKEYANFLGSFPELVPDLSISARRSYSAEVLEDFLQRAKSKGVIVIGGLPTTFEETIIPTGTLSFLKNIYENNGQKFMMLENHSQYDRACFFDKPYHLNSTCQSIHTYKVAALLRNIDDK